MIILLARKYEVKVNLRCSTSWAELILHEPTGKTITSALWVQLTELACFTNCLVNCDCVTGATRERRGVNTENKQRRKQIQEIKKKRDL